MKYNNFRRFYEQRFSIHPRYRHLLDYACLFRMNLIREFIGNVDGKMVVDIGCGGGPLSFLLWFLGARVHSVDISTRALQVTRSLRSLSERSAQFEPSLCRGEAMRLPFKEEVFDVVCCTEILQWCSDDRSTIKEIARVTKPGGKVILAVPYDASLTDMGAGVSYYTERGMVILAAPYDVRVTGKEKLPAYYRRYSFKTLKERLYSRQLRLKRFVFWRFPLVELLDLIRLRNVFAALGLLIEALSNRNISFHRFPSLRDYDTFFHSLLRFYRTKFWRRLALPLLLHILELNKLFQKVPCSNDVFLVFMKQHYSEKNHRVD